MVSKIDVVQTQAKTELNQSDFHLYTYEMISQENLSELKPKKKTKTHKMPKFMQKQSTSLHIIVY